MANPISIVQVMQHPVSAPPSFASAVLLERVWWSVLAQDLEVTHHRSA
jgi:hypothetical protein